MSVFHANEFVMNLPDALKDNTVNVFALTSQGPSEFGVVVARDTPEDGEALVTYVERQVRVLSKRAPLFKLLHQEATTVNGKPAILFDYTWLSDAGTMHQRQVAVMSRPSQVISFTATCKDRISAKWDATFREMIDTLRFRS